MNTNNKLLFFALIFTTFAFAQVGIGTQNPQGAFNVDGAKDNAVSGAPTTEQQSNDFTVLANGNVGIGTTTPSTPLDLQTAASITNTVAKFLAPNNTTNLNATQMNLGVATTAGNAAEWRYVHRGDNNAANRLDFSFSSLGTPVMSYTNNGKVGIGTTGPSAKLEISSAETKTAVTSIVRIVNPNAPAVSNFAGLQFKSNNDVVAATVGSWKIGSNQETTTSSDQNFHLLNSSNGGTFDSKMVLTPAGKVGIGTTNPISKLEVNGAATNSTAYNAAAGTSIDFSLSNLAYTTANPGVFTINNLKDGGTYTLAVQGTTSGSSSFTSTGFTFKSTNNGLTISGKQTLYTFVVMGTTVYYYMAAGF